MDEGSPAAPPGRDRETRSGSGRVLATRGRKIAAIVGGAFLVAVGGVIATRAIAFGEKATRNVFGGGDSVPLTVAVLPRESLRDKTLVPPYYIIPRHQAAGPGSLSETERRALMADGAEWSTWAQAHHGVDGSRQIVDLELRGRTDEPVTVTGIDVTVLERRAPVHGWYLARLVGGCGEEALRLAEVDLDAPTPSVTYRSNGMARETQRLLLSVTRTDQEVVQLEANTDKSLVEWRADVSYSAADGTGSVPVNGGKPFRVSTEIGSKGYEYEVPASGGYHYADVHRNHGWDRRGISVC
jgi:hypothetical protein